MVVFMKSSTMSSFTPGLRRRGRPGRPVAEMAFEDLLLTVAVSCSELVRAGRRHLCSKMPTIM